MVRALYHDSPIYSTLRQVAVDSSPNNLTVQSLYSFISQGTERTVAIGNVPKSAREFMRVPFMKGSFELPITYGYSLAGKVVQEGHDMNGCFVHLMHPHQEECYVPESALRVIPKNISVRRSVLAPNMETAVNGIWNSGVENGDKILVLGFGSVGALLAIALNSMTKTRILIAETNDHRRQIAEQMGFELWDTKEKVNIVFHSTATANALQTGIDILEPYGKLVELSWYGDKVINISLGGSFHYHCKKIISSQVSTIPPHMSGWTFEKRLELVWQLLEDDRCDQIIDKEIDFQDSPIFFEELRHGIVHYLGVVIRYPEN